MTINCRMKVAGSQLGAFPGEDSRRGREGTIPGVAFAYSVAKPDGGKPQHGPVTFTKAWGAATPRIFQSLTTGEHLTSVVFEFLETKADGFEVVIHTVTLTDAVISSVGQHPSESGSTLLEDVSFEFDRIRISHIPSGTSAAADVG